jgi:diguanylate cyclase (GGDEF)-like protein/PAS domain S-box-containing protein
MKKRQNISSDAAELRRRAEDAHSQRYAEENSLLSVVDQQRLLHELQVHQIELELQNEELMQVRAELETALGHYTNLYDFAPVGYFTLDQDGTIRQVNLSGASLLGVKRVQLIDRRFGILVSAESRIVFNDFLQRVFENRSVENCEISLLKDEKEPLYLHIDARISENGQECHAVVMNITERKQLEMEMRYLSTHDPLTGLYNRGYFQETMERLEHGRQFPISIVMADVDHLKETNDHNGHAAGDEMLKHVAQLLTIAFRAEDIIARIGGDEFAVLLPNTDALATKNVLHRLQSALKEHNDTHAGTPIFLSFAASTAEIFTPLMDVLREADEKMYLRKRDHHDP